MLLMVRSQHTRGRGIKRIRKGIEPLAANQAQDDPDRAFPRGLPFGGWRGAQVSRALRGPRRLLGLPLLRVDAAQELERVGPTAEVHGPLGALERAARGDAALEVEPR